MSDSICRDRFELVHQCRRHDRSRITAVVRLCYRLPDEGESVIFRRVELPVATGERWKRTKTRIEATAWDWLDLYFSGSCFGSDQANIFCDEEIDLRTDLAEVSASELSPEQEEELLQELRQIGLDFAV